MWTQLVSVTRILPSSSGRKVALLSPPSFASARVTEQCHSIWSSPLTPIIYMRAHYFTRKCQTIKINASVYYLRICANYISRNSDLIKSYSNGRIRHRHCIKTGINSRAAGVIFRRDLVNQRAANTWPQNETGVVSVFPRAECRLYVFRLAPECEHVKCSVYPFGHWEGMSLIEKIKIRAYRCVYAHAFAYMNACMHDHDRSSCMHDHDRSSCQVHVCMHARIHTRMHARVRSQSHRNCHPI